MVLERMMALLGIGVKVEVGSCLDTNSEGVFQAEFQPSTLRRVSRGGRSRE